jgi:hypothetical protein
MSKYNINYNILRLVQQNNYPMKEWHFEHMQQTILKYVNGLPYADNNSSWKRKQHKKYSGNIGFVRRSIKFDIKHGVTSQEVTEFLNKVRNDSSFSNIRESAGSIARIEELQIDKL